MVKDDWGRDVKGGQGWPAPFPRGEWANPPPDAGSSSSLSKASYRRKRNDISLIAEPSDPEYWQTFLQEESGQHDKYRVGASRLPQSDLPPLCASHPAFTSLRFKVGIGQRDTWCEKYRPQRADEVLGNELEATYLRDWLSALQVGGGRKVVRKVRRPKRELLDGWIVDDIGLFGDAYQEEDDEDDINNESSEKVEELDLPLGTRPTVYPPTAKRLANTILLIGPHGSGKSAAIYAVASELGWEVFEVYAGVGKRTGTNLMSLVGDVGRNHMVVTGETKQEAARKGAIKEYFAVLKPEEAHLSSTQSSDSGPIDDEQDRVKGRVDADIRQSLILIDEADILFGEEYTFWPAVISLIAESRRPVVITCNGA